METQEIRELFITYGTRREKKKNQPIYDPTLGLPKGEAYFLDQGIAALNCIGTNGEEQVYLYFGEQRMIGFSQILAQKYISNQPMNLLAAPSAFWITAKTPCVVYAMEESIFNHLLDEMPAFMNAVLGSLTINYLEVINKVQHSHDVGKDILFCEWLLNCCVCRKGLCVIHKAFTFSEIAKFLGIHPVTVSRIAKKLKNQGIIDRKDGYLVIENKEKLLEMVQQKGTGIS